MLQMFFNMGIYLYVIQYESLNNYCNTPEWNAYLNFKIEKICNTFLKKLNALNCIRYILYLLVILMNVSCNHWNHCACSHTWEKPEEWDVDLDQ